MKEKFINATTIFIMPPDIKTLLNRLKSRKTDSVEDITKRSDIAMEEIKEKNIFDHIIINKDGDLILLYTNKRLDVSDEILKQIGY